MTNRLLVVLILVPLGIILIAFAVANRGMSALTLDPFNPGNPTLTYQAPLFIWIFGALALGLVIGGLATWIKQSHYRKQARERGVEIEAMRAAQLKTISQPALPKAVQ